jgi:ferric-dicitrate binding protein FerR (iron transport regulator)
MMQLHLRENGPSPARLEEAYKRLDASLDEAEDRGKPVFQLHSTRRRWWMVAAAVLVLFAGVSIWKLTGKTLETKILAANYGQTSKHQLPDGSEVMLNANSTVKLGRNWQDGNDREVWLKGEAFFHVAKTSHQNRFIVHTEQMDIIVTGTQFNVITRSDRSSVLLTEGSVTIQSRDGKTVMMKPGDFVEIDNNQLQKKPVNEDVILAWKGNNLFFDNTPLPEAAKVIGEHYGMKVILADPELEQETLTGIMQNNNLDILLKSLEDAKGFKIVKRDKEIIISKP